MHSPDGDEPPRHSRTAADALRIAQTGAAQVINNITNDPAYIKGEVR